MKNSGKKAPETNIEIISENITPAGFFHEKVVQAQERQNLKLSENVEFYLVNLLVEFIQQGPAEQQDDCLALLLKQAVEADEGHQVHLFKRLGDTALYFSGFFQEYFTRKCFDLKYYMSMGENAYSNLSSMMSRKKNGQQQMALIYSDMSENFGSAVDILLDVSENTQQRSKPRDLLSLYDAWLSTASQKLERELRERGVQPISVSKKCVQ